MNHTTQTPPRPQAFSERPQALMESHCATGAAVAGIPSKKLPGLPPKQFIARSMTPDQILTALSNRHFEAVFSSRTTACTDPAEKVRALYVAAWQSEDFAPIIFHAASWNQILSRFDDRGNVCLLVTVDDPDRASRDLNALIGTGLTLPRAIQLMLGVTDTDRED